MSEMPIIQKLREFVEDGNDGTFGTVAMHGSSVIGGRVSALLAEINELRAQLVAAVVSEAERKVIEAAVEAENAHDAFMIELKKNQPYIVTDSYVPAADRWNAARDALSAAVRALTAARGGACEHHWVDARNATVLSGELCQKCGLIRAGNTITPAPEPRREP